MIHARAYRCGDHMNPEGVRSEMAAANPGSLTLTVTGAGIRNEAMVEMLAAQTHLASEAGNLLAKKPEIDLLLRLAGTTQISKALATLGAKAGEEFIAINAGPTELSVPEGWEGLEIPRHELTKSDLASIERAALLDVEKG